MPTSTREGTLQEAREELRRYLSDEIAPAMAADAVATLVGEPAEELHEVVRVWVDGQMRRPGLGLGRADLVFHALRKLVELTEFSLVPRGPLLARIEASSVLWLERMPEDQGRLLRSYLEGLDAAEDRLERAVEVVHRPATASVREGADGHAAATPASTTGTFQVAQAPDAAHAARGEPGRDASLQRLTLLIERLDRRLGAGAGPDETPRAGAGAPPHAAAHALSSAAAGARSAAELEALLDRLERMGVDTRLEQVFRRLGEQVPGWTLPEEAAESGAPIPESRALMAMQRLIDLAEDDAEVSRRFHQLVSAAVERVQAGALAPAVKIFDLAEKVALAQELSGETVASICAATEADLEIAQLVELSQETDDHALLRRILGFFPGLDVRALLARLREEERREQRYHLLALVRVYGAQARPAICDQLRACCEDEASDPQGYFRRNLVFLLRRIPPGAELEREEELALLSCCARADAPLLLVKETIGALCGVRDDDAEAVLIQLLRDVEKALIAANRTGHEPDELRDLLDRVTAGLAQRSSVASARHVANHALRAEEALGDALARIASLGARDLSGDDELVSSLVAHLEAGMPRKVLGVVVARDQRPLAPLVKALSGTFHPEARRVLEEVAARFRGRDFGEIAAKALRRVAPAKPKRAVASGASHETPPGGLEGDLGVFGLPNLLQSLSGSRVTGRLELRDADGEPVGTIGLAEGRLVRCASGALAGEVALFQLLERPAEGRFHFEIGEASAEDEASLDEPVEPLALVLEGVRRHDELQEMLAIVPDGARFVGTQTKPTLPQGVTQQERARGIWHLVSAGETPETCEVRLGLDAHSVRSLIMHWVEAGALRAAEPEPVVEG